MSIRLTSFALFAFFAVHLFFPAAQAQNITTAQPPLPTIQLTIGSHTVTAEVAQTPEQRERGLMHRFTMPGGHGMLFVFTRPQPLSFWMKNTPAPLSIAFIDERGTILNIRDMTPNDDTTLHRSQGNALYALEVRKGWFDEQGIKAGMSVRGLPPAAKQ
ncbi:MAG: DUF192 domain-containing protein [Proteobacteria bacterium]|nr:DUF192 domain-containing protein [Pseudomonadota bacterium]MCL2308382.1 DUF192 domain-containing protein [Pseudomonadota bacterium]